MSQPIHVQAAATATRSAALAARDESSSPSFDRRARAPERLLVDLLHFRADTQSDRIAYRFLPRGEEESASFTYRELRQAALHIAGHLRGRIEPGQRVLLLYPPGLEFMAAFYACLLASIIPVPLPLPRRGESAGRLHHVIEDAEPAAALTVACAQELVLRALGVDSGLPVVWTDRLELSPGRPISRRPPSRQDIAFIQYTSGSTGAPKGVLVTHANLVSNLFQIEQAFGHSAESRAVLWLPHYHDMGLIGGILQPFFVGFEATFMPPIAIVQRPLRWLNAIDRYRATTSGGPNFAYAMCAERIGAVPATLDLSSWEVAFSGAEPVRAATLRAFAQRFRPHGFDASAFLPCYGLAEATLIVTGARKGTGATVRMLRADELGAGQRVTRAFGQALSELVSNGVPRADTSLHIADPQTGQPCAEGVIGEIVVSGSSVSPGYWRDAPGQEDGQKRALRTGDLGFLVEGELFVTGRIKDLIIVRGVNLAPEDIEETARGTHPLLANEAGAAFALELGDEEQLVLIQEVSTRSLDALDFPALTAEIQRAVVAAYGVSAAQVVFVRAGTLDRTTSGKISRSACRTSFINQSLQRVYP